MQFDWLNFSLHLASIITGKANQQLHNSEEKRDLKDVCVSVCPCLHPPHTNRKWPKKTNLTSITISTFVHNAFLMQLWAAGPISFPHCKVKNICSSILVPCLVCTVLDTVRIITKHDFGLITVRWMWTPDTWANTNSPAFHYSPRTAQAISLWAYRGVWRAQIS